MKANAETLKRRCVAGCLDWQRYGSGEPDEVRQATSAYMGEQDTIAQFIAECCRLHAEAKVKVSALHEAYCKWAGDKFMTQPDISRTCQHGAAGGFRAEKTAHQIQGYFFWRYGLTHRGGVGRNNAGEWMPAKMNQCVEAYF